MAKVVTSNGSPKGASYRPYRVSAQFSHKFSSKHIGQIGDGAIGADLMDTRRKEHIAYEYLCHLEEAKKWIEACTEEDLPATTELEEALRNGVILCKLGHYCAPEIIRLKKIYDLDESKYKIKGLHFKHTDNFNYWITSLVKIGLPKIFYPITTDLYDRKNMPRVVYCIHAVSLYLHKLGKAPQIEDLLGTATFTEEEISTMQLELDKYGINMPSFGKIGGVLANQMTVDEATMHAAILAVNDALEKEISSELFAALSNPNTCLKNLEVENADRYQNSLYQAKKSKADAASMSQREAVLEEEKDAYDTLLTQVELQDRVVAINTAVKKEAAEARLRSAVQSVNQAIQSGNKTKLLRSLQSEDTKFTDIHPQNLVWYSDILAKAIRDKAETEGCEECELDHKDIQEMLIIANELADHSRLVEKAVAAINSALGGDSEDLILQTLQNEALDLSDVHPANVSYYQRGLVGKKMAKAIAHLAEEEIQDCIKEINDLADMDRLVTRALASVNRCAEQGDPSTTLLSLQNKCIDVGTIDESCAERYHKALASAHQKGDELSKDEIKKIVEDVNAEVRQERLMAEAVHMVNMSLQDSCEDSEQLLEHLRNEHCGMEHVQTHEALQYLNVLKTARAAKAERTSNPEAELTKEEITSAIMKVNAQASDAVELVEAICAINTAVVSGDSLAILRSLTVSSAGVRSITDECAQTYLEKLAAAKQHKIDTGVKDSEGWSKHRTKEGVGYYHNFRSGKSQWESPPEYCGQSTQLSREEIQAVVTKVTAEFDRWTLMQSNEPLIVHLQACWRGILVRQPYQARLKYLQSNQESAVLLQSHWKGHVQKKAYKERLAFLQNQTSVAIKIQSMAKMWRARRAYVQRLQYLRDHTAEVIKIQAFLRAKKAKIDYMQLVKVDKGTVPPISTVRKFLALLEQSDIDFNEELECQRFKAQVVHEIKSNQQLEQDLDVMDVKIGLLVKNRISLQDVLSTTQQVKHKDKKGNRHSQILDQAPVAGVGGLSKANHEKIEAYQHLFYLLQTNPHYFAKLIFEMPQNRTNRFMENVILTVFNYAQNNREQYLLIKLFDTALKEEIESKVDKLSDIVTGNPTVIKMVIHYTRGERGQNVLRELLGQLIKEVLDQKDLVLNTGPVDVYRAWINNMETQTGEATKLPYDVSNDQALQHEAVRQKVQETISTLCSLASRFQQSIFDNIDKIPYAMRYIAMQLRLLLQHKFPDVQEDDILKIVGNLVYYRYMNPAIVAPDAFDIIDVGVEKQLTPEQRRNLGSIAKVLQHASAGKKFEDENAALSPMNPYIKESFSKFKEFFLRASTVDPPDQKLGIDEYSDVTMLTKPVIYISIKEICSTHSLLIDHGDAVASDRNDPLQLILQDLGPSPSIESLIGGVRDTAPGEDKEDLIAQVGKQEIPLTLTNKFESLAEDDGSDVKALFLRTKRMVVDVLKVQPGDSLTDVLYTPATPEQELEHQELLQKREQAAVEQNQRSTILRKTESLHGDRNLPLEGMKRKIMRNLRALEQEGMVNSNKDYKEVISAIAKDVRNQHRYRQQRKLELKRLTETMDKLSRKASFYEEQMEYYHQYVKACLEQLARAGSKVRVRGSGEDGSGFKRQSIKYNAHKLHEKGVILEIEGLPNHQFRNVSFEITSIDVGVFEVTGRFLGRQIEKVELVFQDLLQLQYEGLAIMKMFGRAKINVNLLIYLINKKFYGRVL